MVNAPESVLSTRSLTGIGPPALFPMLSGGYRLGFPVSFLCVITFPCHNTQENATSSRKTMTGDLPWRVLLPWCISAPFRSTSCHFLTRNRNLHRKGDKTHLTQSKQEGRKQQQFCCDQTPEGGLSGHRRQPPQLCGATGKLPTSYGHGAGGTFLLPRNLPPSKEAPFGHALVNQLDLPLSTTAHSQPITLQNSSLTVITRNWEKLIPSFESLLTNPEGPISRTILTVSGRW